MSLTPVDVPQITVRDGNVPPTTGRIVIYVGKDGYHWPAIVTRGLENDVANMVVLSDTPPAYKAQVVHDEEYSPDTWHWPPPRELVFKSVPITALEPTPSETTLVNE